MTRSNASKQKMLTEYNVIYICQIKNKMQMLNTLSRNETQMLLGCPLQRIAASQNFEATSEKKLI